MFSFSQLFAQFWQMVSSLGGNLGLFIGMSILSMLEVLELLLDLLLILAFPGAYAGRRWKGRPPPVVVAPAERRQPPG